MGKRSSQVNKVISRINTNSKSIIKTPNYKSLIDVEKVVANETSYNVYDYID